MKSSNQTTKKYEIIINEKLKNHNLKKSKKYSVSSQRLTEIYIKKKTYKE